VLHLVIGNRTYSSWSLRAWLACRQSGLPFTETVVPLYGDNWEVAKRANPLLQPSAGKVPVLWDGDTVVWDSLAILEFLADTVGRDRFWPRDPAARALARSMVYEMHSGFGALRSQLPMNLRQRGAVPLDSAVQADVVRILSLWAEARSRFGGGGPFLFGSFGAADIAFAPVVGRFLSYDVPVPGFAAAYMEALWEHDWLRAWVSAASEESWTIASFDQPTMAAAHD
jgi:glutathione S-transferase